MKTFIPSWQRPLSIKTHKLFPPHADYRVVVGNKFEASDYKLNSTIPKDRIVQTGQGFGIGKTRDWIIQNGELAEGEWFCMMDDNIERVTRLVQGKDVDMSWSMFEVWRQQMVDMATTMGASLVGVAVVDNPFFREKQYRSVGFVRGKIMLIKKSILSFNKGLASKEDYDFTAQNLYAFGRVLVDNSVYPVAKSYAQGGCGPKSQRARYDIAAAQYLLKQWPDLFRIKEKESSAPESEVQLRFTSLEQVQKWRNDLASQPAPK